MIRKIYQVDREIGGFLAHEPPDPTKETLGIKPQKDAQSEAARRGFGGEEEMDKRYLPGTSDNPRTKKREYFNIENVPAETDEYADIELAQKPPKGQVLTWRDPDFYRSTVVGQTEPKRGRIRKSTTVGSVEKEGIQRNYSLEKGGGYSKRERGTSSLGQPADKGKKYRKSWGKPSATRRRNGKREYFNIENVPAETDEYADIELAQKPPKGQVLTWRDPDFYRSTVVGQTEPKRGRIRKSTTVGSVEKEGIQRNYSLEKGGGYSKRERGTSSLGQPADKGKKYRKSWGKPSATRRRNGK